MINVMHCKLGTWVVASLSVVLALVASSVPAFAAPGAFVKATTPVLVEGDIDDWDAIVTDPTIIKEGNTYHMWYGANGPMNVPNDDPAMKVQIGYATSTTGTNFTKYTVAGIPTPVLSPGASGAWDDADTELPMVTKDGATYKMWYSGRQWVYDPDTDTYNRGPYRIGYATASLPQGPWTKDIGNPVFVPTGALSNWESAGVAGSQIIKDGNTFHMWYWGVGFPGGSLHFGIGYATSCNGTAWTRQAGNIIPLGASGAWDDHHVFQPHVRMVSPTHWEMWYTGLSAEAPFNNNKLGFATATAPEGPWTKYSGNPVIVGGPAAWDSHGVVSSRVTVEDNTYKMWFGGWNSEPGRFHGETGYATALETAVYPDTANTGPNGTSVVSGSVADVDEDDNVSFVTKCGTGGASTVSFERNAATPTKTAARIDLTASLKANMSGATANFMLFDWTYNEGAGRWDVVLAGQSLGTTEMQMSFAETSVDVTKYVRTSDGKVAVLVQGVKAGETDLRVSHDLIRIEITPAVTTASDTPNVTPPLFGQGSYKAGAVTDLATNNNIYYETYTNDATDYSTVGYETTGFGTTSVSRIDVLVRLKSSVASTNLNVLLFNWISGTWIRLNDDTMTLGTAEAEKRFNLTNEAAKFVKAADGRVAVLIEAYKTGGVPQFFISTDHIEVSVTQ